MQAIQNEFSLRLQGGYRSGYREKNSPMDPIEFPRDGTT
jgi:hypothetical protein